MTIRSSFVLTLVALCACGGDETESGAGGGKTTGSTTSSGGSGTSVGGAGGGDVAGYTFSSIELPPRQYGSWDSAQAAVGSPAAIWLYLGTELKYFDGASWTDQDLQTGTIASVYAPSATVAFAVGNIAEAHRWDGSSWTADPFDFGYPTAYAIFASSATDAWIGTDTNIDVGPLYFADGSTWTRADFAGQWPTDGWDVWSDGPTEVYVACGSAGVWRRGSGGVFAEDLQGSCFRVAGAGPDEVWAICNDGTRVVRRSGGTWADVEAPQAKDIAVLAADDVWLVDYQDAAFHWDGNAWSPLSGPNTPTAQIRLARAPRELGVWFLSETHIHHGVRAR
ncbi:MAG: hypothetical protein JRI23_27355 [Deltaproteobacteria bacterium]|nr:hypothetical protein [Deltaproteobacteria bacterium]MBW2535797.1 hypothetical protein [Deltaproteobacteria bacterium]